MTEPAVDVDVDVDNAANVANAARERSRSPPPVVAVGDSLEKWGEIVLQDWKQLQNAPPECKNDPDLVCEATRLSLGEALRFADISLRRDREFVLGATAEVGMAVLEHAARELRWSRSFALEVSKKCPPMEVLQWAAKELRVILLKDREFLLQAVRRTGPDVLKMADERLRSDRPFVAALANHLPLAKVSEYASDQLRPQLYQDRTFMLHALRGTGVEALTGLSDKLRVDSDFMIRAVGSGGPLVLQHASQQLRQSPSFLLQAARAVGVQQPAMLQELVGMDSAVSASDYWVDEGSSGYWDIEGLISDYQLACREQGVVELEAVPPGARKGSTAPLLLIRKSMSCA